MDKTNNSNTEKTIENPPKVDKNYIKLSKLKRKILKRVWLARSVLGAFVVLISLLLISIFGHFFKDSTLGRYFLYAKNFAFVPQDSVKSVAGRTNVLILGKGGAGHDAPDLTDTIIFASISKSDVFMLSIPRDIWIPEIRAKVNSAYYWGNQKEEGGGLVLAKSMVEKIVGQPIHYAVVFDFSSFKEIIDAIGGIEVEVENSFVDNKYPIAGKEDDLCNGDKEFKCRYETVSFEKGLTTMDGETALKFVRSRYSEGDEGTDIAREKRQQKVISGIKNKVLSFKFLISFKKVKNLITILDKYTETDIKMEEAATLARMALSSKDDLSSSTIPDEFLENPKPAEKYDFLYVFIPSSGSWDQIHEWVNGKLEKKI